MPTVCELSLYKFVHDTTQYSSSQRIHPGGWAITYHTLFVGEYKGDGAFIVNNVAQLMDKFIDYYLRVNAAACRRR